MALGLRPLTQIGVSCLALPPLSALAVVLLRPRVALERRICEESPTVGGRGVIQLRLTTANLSGRTRFTVVERTPWVVGGTMRWSAVDLSFRSSTTLSYAFSPTCRGLLDIGPSYVYQHDPCGLVRYRVQTAAAMQLVVLPAIHPLSDVTGLESGLSREGDAPGTVLTGSEYDLSLRDYREGDELRRIHWKASAHRGRLMVRHESRPHRRRALLVLDCAPQRWGASAAGSSAAFEWAVSWVASVAAHLDGDGFGLHLLLFDADSSADTEDAARPLPLSELLLTLATVQLDQESADRTQNPAPITLSAVSDVHMPDSGGVIVLVTGHQGPPSSRSALELLRPGLIGSAVFLDVAAFAGNAAPGGLGAVESWCDHAAAGGWHTVAVRPGMTAAEVWSGLRRERGAPAAAWEGRW
ncbi:DUF58 domain-containing protein [Austwickia chelonae]|nr:DUF58 domain-containing protein [Austwickia chelonae]